MAMIIRLAIAFGFVAFLLILWQECGGNLGTFGYRLGLGAFFSARSRALAVVPAIVPATRSMFPAGQHSRRR